jgi:hypothetical protein
MRRISHQSRRKRAHAWAQVRSEDRRAPQHCNATHVARGGSAQAIAAAAAAARGSAPRRGPAPRLFLLRRRSGRCRSYPPPLPPQSRIAAASSLPGPPSPIPLGVVHRDAGRIAARRAPSGSAEQKEGPRGAAQGRGEGDGRLPSQRGLGALEIRGSAAISALLALSCTTPAPAPPKHSLDGDF